MSLFDNVSSCYSKSTANSFFDHVSYYNEFLSPPLKKNFQLLHKVFQLGSSDISKTYVLPLPLMKIFQVTPIHDIPSCYKVFQLPLYFIPKAKKMHSQDGDSNHGVLAPL